MYKNFFYELILKIQNFEFDTIHLNNFEKNKEIENVLNKINKFRISLEDSLKKNDSFFETEFENNIENRKFLTCMQAIFGGFTGSVLKDFNEKKESDNLEVNCALLMFTNSICSPFYLSFLEDESEKINFINNNIYNNLNNNDYNLVSDFLLLRSKAISSFLEINGNFINLFKEDYKNFDFYKNIEKEISSLQKKHEKNLIYKKSEVDEIFDDNAFYIIHYNNLQFCDLIFIINVESSQINSKNQKTKSKIKIYSLDSKNLHKSDLYSRLCKSLNQNQINLNEILNI
jgi:hypothetical protein